MVISVQTYEQVALEDGDETWELADGILRRKPGMTSEHNEVMDALATELRRWLARRDVAIRVTSARLRIPSGSYYVPDLVVVPREMVERVRRLRPRGLEVFEEPLPLVVEVRSRSTGEYDVEVKLRDYQIRDDQEIWRLHPYERALTAWRLRPDGDYTQSEHRGGTVRLAALPEVTIEVASLFALFD